MNSLKSARVPFQRHEIITQTPRFAGKVETLDKTIENSNPISFSPMSHALRTLAAWRFARWSLRLTGIPFARSLLLAENEGGSEGADPFAVRFMKHPQPVLSRPDQSIHVTTTRGATLNLQPMKP